MKKILIYPLLLSVLLFNSSYLSAQNAGIFYELWSPNSDCNIFMNSTFVNNVQHRTVLGQPIYDGTTNSVSLKAIMIQKPNPPHEYRGTSFRINYPFKKGYSYRILVRASRSGGTPSNALVLGLEVVNTSTTNSGCAGTELTTYNTSNTNTYKYQYINSDTPVDLDYRFSTLPSAYGFLVISAASNNIIQREALIKNIRIEETAPELELEPTMVATKCGIATTQTFTVDNPSGLENITSYEWNLGSASNGWTYNGSPAPQNITTSSNSLNLTSVCNATTVRNVGVTIKVNNATYKTYTSTISRTTPVPTITGLADYCYATPTYSIDNLPCSGTVTWSATGSLSITGSSTANPVTLAYNGSGGPGTLTATVNTSCSSNPIVVTKNINAPVSYDVLGSSSFCVDANYSIYGLPANSIVVWSVDGNLNINGANNYIYEASPGINISTVQILANNPYQFGTVTATITTPCGGTVIATKDVYTTPAIINAKFITGVIGQYGLRIFTGGTMYITLDEVPNAEFYEWYDVDNNVMIATTTTPYLLTTSYDYSCGIHGISIRAYTNCAGYTDPYELLYEGDCDPYSRYSIYPNPADATLTISTSELKNEDKLKNYSPKEFMLYNDKGKMMFQLNRAILNNQKIDIPTQDLPNGTYFLHIKDGEKVEKRQIIIKH